MADKESGEDILRAILEKGNKNVKDQVAKILEEQTAAPAPKTTTRKKKLGAVVGKIGTSRFFRTPEGVVVDEEGKPVNIGLAKAFAQYEPKAKAAEPAAQPSGQPTRGLERELKRSIQSTSNIVKAQETINKKVPVVTDGVIKLVDKMSKQNEQIIGSFMQQNQEFQDKVVEAMTGVKAPTRAGGAKKKLSRAAGASRASMRVKPRDTERAEYVRQRAENIAAIRMKRNITIAAGVGLAGIGAGLAAYKGLESLIKPGETPAGAAAGGGGAAPSGPITKFEGLGSISAKYESGGRGVHTVSSGAGDPGGVSYGTHQLATNTGTMARYLSSAEAKDYAGKFSGLQPGTEPFNQVYKQVAASDPQGFAASQKAFITRTHFDPVSKHAGDLGWAVADPRVQEVLYSMGVQHGGAKKIVSQAGNPQGKSVEEQVKMLFEARKSYVAGVSKMPESTRQSLYKRYASEERDVLAMSTTAGTATAAAPSAPSAAAGAATTAAGARTAMPGPSGPSAAAGAAQTAATSRVSMPGPSGAPAAMAAAASTTQAPPGAPTAEQMGAGGGAANVKMSNQGATRNKPVTPYLLGAISTAVKDVYGPEARAEIYSGGQESHPSKQRTGSTRHDNGMAADVYVYVGGRKVSGDDLGRLAQYWLARRLGGAGIEMRGGGIHLDQHTDRHPYWFYNAGETAKSRAMVMAGVQGQMPDAAGQTMIAEGPGAPAGTAAGGAPRQYAALGASSRANEIREMNAATARPVIIDNTVMNSQQIIYRNSQPVGARGDQFNPMVAGAVGIGKALRLF
jgi:hypothetical protein